MTRARRADLRSGFAKHPVIQRILKESGVECAREAMRRRAFEVVVAARKSGWEGPPYDIAVLASLRGFRIDIVDWLSEGQDGFFMAGTPPTIYVNDRISRRRARFTIAHEIIHPLIPNTTVERFWRYQIDSQSPIEQLCQVGASELLMPSDVFDDFTNSRPLSRELVDSVVDKFDVSIEAAVRNLVDRSTQPCAMIVLELRNKPSEVHPANQMALPGLEPPVPEKRLRAAYAWTSRAWDDVYIPPFKSIPEFSCIYEMLNSTRPIDKAQEDWGEFASLGACSICAFRDSTDRILALVAAN